MLVGRQNDKGARRQKSKPVRVRTAADVARRRPAGVVSSGAAVRASGPHPFSRAAENVTLYQYESRSKEAFDRIEKVLRQIAQHQHQVDFVTKAQEIAQRELGFALPSSTLDKAWVSPLDVRSLYAWCVFETFRRFADEFYTSRPLEQARDEGFQDFLESCGFHTLDFSPCADGRLAHIIRYVLRLPHKAVRRKSYAGAMFDVEDSLQKWMETELTRYREAKPNDVTAPTRYLKAAVYHYSGSQPDREGCAAHGSDAAKAAEGALSRLVDFRQGVENSFCCGASIDLLLIGIDTDNDAIRVHLPDADGSIGSDRYIDAMEIYQLTYGALSEQTAERVVGELVEKKAESLSLNPLKGMKKLAARLLLNNISQIDYVRSYFGGCYRDIGHQERFIGMGIGFEEVQLRNLTYFAYLKTVEQGAKDLDVGVKIFTGLNINRGLPVPVVIRYDYHGNVPGARDRAVSRCRCLDVAMRTRFADQSRDGLLHTLLVVRDCSVEQSIEVVGSSLHLGSTEDLH